MQHFDALFIILCPLEAENTHLQTYSHKGATLSLSFDEEFNRSFDGTWNGGM